MKENCLIFALTSLMFFSCKNDSNILVNVHEVDFLNKTGGVIEGKKVMSVLGAKGLVVYDTLIMVTTNNPEGQLQVYRCGDLKYLGSFCKQGRARNELLKASTVTEQAYYKDNHLIQIVYDVPTTMCEVDVTASIQSGHTVVISSRECLSTRGNEIMLLGDDYNNRLEFELNKYGVEEITGVPSRYTLYKNGKKKNLRFFKKIMKVEDEEQRELPYQGSLYKHPLKNLIVQSFANMDYLLYMNFEADSCFAVHQKGSLTFTDRYVDEMPMPLHFSDGATSNNYIMFLYRQGYYTQKTTAGEWFPEVLIFDWNGNYISGFKTDRFIHYIEYDEINHALYGINNDDEIYVYDLSTILS